MHRHNIIALPQRATPHPPQLLHMPANAENESQVDTERPDIGARLAADPEYGEVAFVVEFEEFGLVDGADAELAFDG